MNAEVGEDLGFGFVNGQQVMAGGAVLGDAGSVFRGVVAVVAAEAAGIVHVADVVGMSSPGHLHVREHVLAVECDQFIAGRLDLLRLVGGDTSGCWLR